MPAFHYRSTVHTHHGAIIRLRATDQQDNRLTATDIQSIAYSIYQQSATADGTAVTGHTSVNVPIADAVLDAYASWDLDTTGYNIRINIHSGTDPFPIRGNEYRIDIVVQTFGGHHVLTVFEVVAI